MATVNVTENSVENGDMLFENAFRRLHPQMQSLDKDELLTVNLDIPSAVVTVLGIQPELTALKDEIAQLPSMDVESVLNVDLYARALAHAHTLYMMASNPSDTLHSLVEEGTKLREVLLADASALARRKLLNPEQLKELAGPVGYKSLAFDLQLLGSLFEAHFPSIQGKWGTQKSEILRAQQIAAGILKLVGLREQSAARIAEASDMRSRAFTLFLRTYDETRRAVTFLRWHKSDVNDITPSLYANKGRRKEERAVDGPVAGQSTVVAPPAGDNPFAPRTDVPAPAAPARPEPGTPTANPFLA